MVRTGHIRYFTLRVEIKDCKVMIVGKNLFDQPAKNNVRIIYDNIRKIVIG